MVVATGKFILMCFGNLIWPGLGNFFIGFPMGRISSRLWGQSNRS
jgi:tRNA(Arg) A34 adenosine deaminase TadA